MAKYTFYSAQIPIDPESELYKRLEQSAQLRGISLEKALEEAVQIGCWEHISRNLAFIERYSAEQV